MAKCSGCGKFISPSDVSKTIKCSKCVAVFHRVCVNLMSETRVPTGWICPGCKVKQPHKDNSDTPIKNTVSDQDLVQQDDHSESPGECNVMAASLRGDGDLALELQLMRNELASVRAEMISFRQEMAKFTGIMKEFGCRMNDVEKRISILESSANDKDNDNHQRLDNTIVELKRELNERDQDLLLNDVEISGCPETSGENTVHLVTLIAKKLNVELEERDVVSVARVSARSGLVEGGASPRARPIALRLARRSLRDALLRGARVRRGADTAGLGLSGAPTRFYVNERLTKTNRRLFYLARVASQRERWKYVWTRDGRILARKDSGKPIFRICSEHDIDEVFGCSTVGTPKD